MIDDLPAIAIETSNRKEMIVAVGREAVAAAARVNTRICNGFEHPRTLIADFTVAERTLRFFVKKVMPKTVLSLAPVIVIHPQALLEGGLTQIETRAFAELGAAVGGKRVYVWEVRILINLNTDSGGT